jgi:hypothetical protein
MKTILLSRLAAQADVFTGSSTTMLSSIKHALSLHSTFALIARAPTRHRQAASFRFLRYADQRKDRLIG